MRGTFLSSQHRTKDSASDEPQIFLALHKRLPALASSLGIRLSLYSDNDAILYVSLGGTVQNDGKDGAQMMH